MNIEKERKAFEEWAYSNKWNICRYPKSDYHMKEGQYCDEFVGGAWHGWIKSANREGYKLVPVNYECVWCGCTELDGWTNEAMIGACDAQQEKTK